MRIIAGRAKLGEAGRRPRTPSLALGNFDGVHRGHRALIDLACARAVQSGGEAGVLTFDPHPAAYFAPNLVPPMLTPMPRRLELLAETDLDFAIVEPFDRGLAEMEAPDFIKTVLAHDIGARHVIVGYDFHFGKGRQGDGDLLRSLGRVMGIDVDVVEAVTVSGLVCSSTKIREFVLEGRVEGARLLLGRPYEISGTVIAGEKRGRTLGFPTANIEPDGELLPRPGIYAGFAVGLGDTPVTAGLRCAAAISVGTNPTFSGTGQLSIEAHLVDFVGNLYGARLRLELVMRLRDEQRFDNVDALLAQMREDVARTREHCAE